MEAMGRRCPVEVPMHRRVLTEAEPLNLIPIMNLVTLLIPFLLMSAQFVAYAIIDSRAPAICDADCGEGPEPGMTVTLGVDRSGFLLTTTAAAGDEHTIELACLTESCTGDPTKAYDIAGLRAALTRLKDTSPGTDSLILVPSSDLPYASLILAMDASREDPEAAALPGEDCRGRCLFPRVTVAGGG